MTETCEHCHYHEPEGDHLFLKIVTFLTVGSALTVALIGWRHGH